MGHRRCLRSNRGILSNRKSRTVNPRLIRMEMAWLRCMRMLNGRGERVLLSRRDRWYLFLSGGIRA